MAKTHKKKNTNKKDLIFYISIVFLPFLNFVVLNFYVNYIDVFLFVFKKYDISTGTYAFTSDLLYNFRLFFSAVKNNPSWKTALGVTLKSYVFGWITMPISLLIPFYVAKKYPGHKAFKFILMMPGMIASMVWSLLYLNLVDDAIPQIFNLEMGLIANPDTEWITLQIQGIWLGIGGNVLFYSGIFSGISDSVIDAGKIDGLGPLREFWHIYFPTLYPIWIVGIYGGLSAVFTSYAGLYEMFGYGADSKVSTIGYLLFVQVMRGGADGVGLNCAGSIVITLITTPIVLGFKYLFEHIGPSEDERISKKRRVTV